MPLPLLAILAGLAGGTAAAGTAIGAARRSGKKRNPLEDLANAEERAPEPQGMFSSVMDTISGPGDVAENLLMGNFEGAGRRTVDFLGDLIDAPLPGDWIPHISRVQDKPEFSDLAGGMEPGLAKFGVDVLGGIATDPLSYVPGKTVAKGLGAAGKLIEKGVSKLPKGTQEGIKDAYYGVKDTVGGRVLKPDEQDVINKANAAGQNIQKAGQPTVNAIKQSLTADEKNIVGEIIDNLYVENGIPKGRVLPEAAASSATSRVAAHRGVTPENIDRIRKAVEDSVQFGRTQAAQNIREGAGLKDLTAEGKALPDEYLKQIHEGIGKNGTAKGSSLKERTLVGPEEKISAYATDEYKGTKYVSDVGKRLDERLAEEARLHTRASIGKSLLGDEFKGLDEATSAKITERIDALKDVAPDYHRALRDTFNGLEARGPILEKIAKFNRVWKPIVVAGFVMPKVGSLVRNTLTTGTYQLATTQGLKAAGKNALAAPAQVIGALDDAIVKAFGLGKRLTGSEISQAVDLIDEAYRRSGGDVQQVGNFLRQAGREDLAMAADSGILQGHVSSEEMLRDLDVNKVLKGVMNILDGPGAAYQGVESRMRLGNFLNGLKEGKPLNEVVRNVNESFLDYNIASKGGTKYRTFRDLIPFAAYLSQSVAQQGKFLAKNPAAAVGLSQALNQGQEEPIPPWMEGKLNIPLGDDTAGNAQYVTGLGLPFESLAMLPDVSGDPSDLGRDVKRNLVGSSQPILKTLAGEVFGQDPYFETPFGSYDKVPLMGHQGDFGQNYNVLNSLGLMAPYDVPARQLDQLMNPDRSAGVKALDLLTGANVVSVDEDRAAQQQLERLLKNNPDISQYRTFYQTGDDPDLEALLTKYKQAKKAARKDSVK